MCQVDIRPLFKPAAAYWPVFVVNSGQKVEWDELYFWHWMGVGRK